MEKVFISDFYFYVVRYIERVKSLLLIGGSQSFSRFKLYLFY